MMNFKSTLFASVLCSLFWPPSVAFAQTGVQGSLDTVQVYAAGSLRGPMTKIATEYQERTGQKIVLTFGASGLLRERIEKGESASVFASADTMHPQRLADGGSWRAPVVFVRNAMCALTSEKVSAEPSTLLSVMLKPEMRVGTSTPKSDPSGDYAWALFAKAETVQTGAYKTLDAKALKLTGAANSPQPPNGRTFYEWAMDEGQADVFLTYCTNAIAAQVEVPRLKVVQMPPELQVGAAYALTVNKAASTAAVAFAQALLEQPAQVIFNRFGFGSP
ncbi:MAG: molybdate ABC transporter substrate-binding protein [Rhodoferax sp.]|nr:molybdate ABC transporter substrate-binding protein [Rhodoferax sp.]MCF8210398.1 molybdate ABC transporter substrate-binding protein [Rhodoferax sp.]